MLLRLFSLFLLNIIHFEGTRASSSDLSNSIEVDASPMIDIETHLLPPSTLRPVPVPHLWANFSRPTDPPASEVACQSARIICAYRKGCGAALQNYLFGCSQLASGNSSQCNSHCRHALIALASTYEGRRLFECDCGSDASCELSRSRVQTCSAAVSAATADASVVSCTTAQWICGADPGCAMALDYYNRFCSAMFRGRRCSARCRNSIQILGRQRAARKLDQCRCQGESGCEAIKQNMQRLCFQRQIDNEIEHNNHINVASKNDNQTLLITFLTMTIIKAILHIS